MNKFTLWGAAICLSAVAACGGGNNNHQTGAKDSSYGEKFDVAKAVPVDQALKTFNEGGSADAIISGSISQVCQSEGCWYSIKNGSADQFVEFGEKFTVPKDIVGKSTVAAGSFYRDTTSVEDLRKEAVMEGKSESEAAKISTPRVSTNFIAKGLIIKK